MKPRTFLVRSFLLCLALPTAAQTTWFVDDDNCPAGTGTQADPFCTIQAAVDAAASGDTILVLAGAYGNIDYDGKDVVIRSLEGPADTSVTGADFVDGEGVGAVLDGFTVNGPQFTSAILCSGASPTISNNIIEGNFSLSTGGAGIRLMSGSDARILYNEIRDNQSIPTSGLGGGMFISASSPLLEGNRFVRNNAFEDFSQALGGAIYISGSNVSLLNNFFLDNLASDTAGNKGGAIYAVNSTLLLAGNSFVDNAAVVGLVPGEGGALYLESCVTQGVNNIFWGNRAAVGAQIFVEGGVLNLSYSNVEAGLPGVGGNGAANWGSGMLDTDPLFDATFHLSAGSPMIEAGTPLDEFGGADGDLDPRALDGDADGTARVDIGWDEWNLTSLSLTGNGALGSSFDLATDGTPGQSYILAGSLDTGERIFGSFGALLISLQGLQVVGRGIVPGSDSLAVPNDPTLVGIVGSFQALALFPGQGIGSFSRRVDVTLH